MKKTIICNECGETLNCCEYCEKNFEDDDLIICFEDCHCYLHFCSDNCFYNYFLDMGRLTETICLGGIKNENRR